MTAPPLRSLLELLPIAFHRIGAATDALHAPLGLSSCMRGMLLALERNGATTVSKLAAMRAVSRQFMQRVADDLLAGGWVEATPNPAHKRSPLMILTPRGQQALAAMRVAETPHLARLALGLDTADVEAAARVLRQLVETVSSEVVDQLAAGGDEGMTSSHLVSDASREVAHG